MYEKQATCRREHVDILSVLQGLARLEDFIVQQFV